MMQSNRRNFMKFAGASLMTLNSSLIFAEDSQGSLLSLDQQQALAYLWNYEKMQKDVFTQLHTDTDIRIYETFANYSKTSQRAVVEEIISLYQVDITDTGAGLIVATESELRNMELGEFGLSALENTYNNFISEGSSSSKDALLAGAKAVVKEIDKIDVTLALFTNHAKITENLNYLKSSSMGQYWRIDHELKAKHD